MYTALDCVREIVNRLPHLKGTADLTIIENCISELVENIELEHIEAMSRHDD